MTEESTPNLEAALTNPSSISKVDLMKLLDMEIELIVQKQTWKGYTTWALLGALAALGWLLLETLENGTYIWITVAQIFLCLQLLNFSLGILRYAFFSLKPPNRSGRFKYIDIFQLGAYISGAFHSSVLILIIFQYFGNAAPMARLYLISLFLGFGFACVGGAILQVVFRVPMDFVTSAPKWEGKLVWTLAVVGILLAGLNLAGTIKLSSVTFDEIRISLLLMVLTELVYRLGATSRDLPMLQSLIFIRREVALEKADLNAAVNQTEIVLAGMRANDCLQDEIRAYLEPAGRIVAVFHDAISKIEAVCADLPKAERLSKERETVARTVLDACEEMTTRAVLDLKIVQARRAKLVSRMRWLGGQTEETKDVYAAMDKALNALLTTTKEYRAKALQLEARLGQSTHAKTDP